MYMNEESSRLFKGFLLSLPWNTHFSLVMLNSLSVQWLLVTEDIDDSRTFWITYCHTNSRMKCLRFRSACEDRSGTLYRVENTVERKAQMENLDMLKLHWKRLLTDVILTKDTETYNGLCFDYAKYNRNNIVFAVALSHNLFFLRLRACHRHLGNSKWPTNVYSHVSLLEQNSKNCQW